VTPEQITAVLARADEQARREGPDLSPAVAQAAAELGMLYTTYLVQELASSEATEGLRVQDAPVARAAGDDDGAGTTAATDALAAAIPVSDEHSAVRPAAEADADADAGSEPTATSAGEADLPSGRIAYHQVVLAAVRLANMLDPSVPSTLVEVEASGEGQEPSSRGSAGSPGARDRGGDPLRDSLLDVVSAFGTSTLE
jgi:hypothetical protein